MSQIADKRNVATIRHRCFVRGCENKVQWVKSWLEGPTMYACFDHDHLLPAKPVQTGQQVLL